MGRLPASKPGNPAKLRRKTKPLRRGGSMTGVKSASIKRGMTKQYALVERAWRVRRSRIASALRRALGAQ